MLRRWMANDPDILGSDVDVLDAIKDGDCDVGLTNSYYLGRELNEDPDFPVAPVWADQNGRGTHVNLSGLGVVKGTGQREKAIQLIGFLTEPAQQRVFAHNNFEFAADGRAPGEGDRPVRRLQAGPDRREGSRRAPRRRPEADAAGWVGLRKAAAAVRPAGSAIGTVLLRLLVAGPLVGLPICFIVAPDHFGKYSGFLPEALEATGFLLVGVGTGTLLLGTSLAALVSFFDFPGRRWIEWALVLPLAMPGYVFTLFALGLDLPGIRSTLGAVAIFTLVLYPYVYLLARAAFLAQSRTLIEAARGLGLSRGRAIVRVGLPLARPAILGGVALALMEALADFGTVNLLGVRTFTDAIYRVWFNAFDREAAMQFATLLMSVTLTLLLLERLARGRARHAQLAARGDVVRPVRLHGPPPPPR